VIRFRRGLIVGVAAAAVSALAAIAWVSLQPISFAPARDSASATVSGAPPEAVAGAPASYADVPQLGPPLPGDLGRAIVDRSRSAIGDDPALANGGNAGAGRQRQASERQAALLSPVLARLSRASPRGPADAPIGPASGEGAGAAVPGDSPPAASESPPESGGPDGGAVLSRPGSPWTLSAGTVIPASLLTGLNSDLPGLVVAQVTGNVRDSATGRTVLIPQGSRLIGDYDSHVGAGQRRVLLVWKRLLLPDGSSVGLGGIPAADASGYSGLEDEVDVHEWSLLKGVVLSSLLGLGSELGTSGEDRDLVRALRDSASSSGSSAGEAIVSQVLKVKPTLTVRPGWPVRAVLHRDLVLRPWRGR
jgi:type IV secretion system protein VirB10